MSDVVKVSLSALGFVLVVLLLAAIIVHASTIKLILPLFIGIAIWLGSRK
jgi:hypothetical protein